MKQVVKFPYLITHLIATCPGRSFLYKYIKTTFIHNFPIFFFVSEPKPDSRISEKDLKLAALNILNDPNLVDVKEVKPVPDVIALPKALAIKDAPGKIKSLDNGNTQKRKGSKKNEVRKFWRPMRTPKKSTGAGKTKGKRGPKRGSRKQGRKSGKGRRKTSGLSKSGTKAGISTQQIKNQIRSMSSGKPSRKSTKALSKRRKTNRRMVRFQNRKKQRKGLSSGSKQTRSKKTKGNRTIGSKRFGSSKRNKLRARGSRKKKPRRKSGGRISRKKQKKISKQQTLSPKVPVKPMPIPAKAV